MWHVGVTTKPETYLTFFAKIFKWQNRCTKGVMASYIWKIVARKGSLSCNAIKLNDPFRATNCENTIFNSAIKDIGIGFSDLCWFVSIFHYTKGTYPFRATPIPLSRNDFENEQKTYKNWKINCFYAFFWIFLIWGFANTKKY